MARARPALQTAINDILIRNGSGGKRLSLRQAERLTGLSPATVGELAKGNARTAETIRRFANGFGEDANRLLMLGGFVPDEPGGYANAQADADSVDDLAQVTEPTDQDISALADRLAACIARIPAGPDREMWKHKLRTDTEIAEAFLRSRRCDDRAASSDDAVGEGEADGGDDIVS